MAQTHLWDMDTLWFSGNENQHIQTVFRYKSWNEFQECKPYKLWKPYIVSSWSWKHIARTESAFTNKCMKQELEKHTMNVHAAENDVSMSSEPGKGEPLELLQILIISPDRFAEIHRVEIRIKRDDEEHVRTWLINHMPTLWKL